MCWRDNERNYGAENARREMGHLRSEQEKRGRDWALSATVAQKRAALSIDLLTDLLSIVVRINNKMSEPIMLMSGDLHQHFSIFASGVGLQGHYYKNKKNKCPAVTFHGLLSGIEDDKWMCFIRYCVDIEKQVGECLSQARELNLRVNKKILISSAEAFFGSLRI